jgi:hypothetical protein
VKYLTAYLLISLCGAAATAQNDDSPPGSAMTLEQLKANSSAQRTKRSSILEVSPAAEPVPALKYRFRPAIWEKKPTRALLHYMRANTDLLERAQGSWQKYETDAWLEKEHPEAPSPEQLAEAVGWLESVFSEIHQLALPEDFSWDHRLRDLRGPDVYQYRLPDVQQARRFAHFLNMRVRHQLNQDDIEGAIESIHDGLRLAEFVSEDEFAIQQLWQSPLPQLHLNKSMS